MLFVFVFFFFFFFVFVFGLTRCRWWADRANQSRLFATVGKLDLSELPRWDESNLFNQSLYQNQSIVLFNHSRIQHDVNYHWKHIKRYLSHKFYGDDIYSSQMKKSRYFAWLLMYSHYNHHRLATLTGNQVSHLKWLKLSWKI